MNPATPSAPRSSVLVVDDVTKNLQIVGTMLRNAGYAVTPATSGEEALEGVRIRVPDLILLDLMMPGMDGLEVCRRLKAVPVTVQIPVIFLTASNEMEHLVKGFEVGAVDYVTKPFNPPELLARVRTHLELKHARDVIFRYSVELRRLNDEKNEFMGIAAHDLRNPLSAIQGYAEMIVEDAQGLEHQELAENGQRIRAMAGRMVEMVQNLLDANRIERGEMKPNLAAVDLETVITSVVANHRSRAALKQQKIDLEIDGAPAMAWTDSSFIVQILENLVSNAIKYSPLGKCIWVRLVRTPELVRCTVRDEGPGLSAEDQDKLFGKFARLSAKPTGGELATGLGLSIVKRMVDAMGGKIRCESQAGCGAAFILEVPAAPNPASEAATTAG